MGASAQSTKLLVTDLMASKQTANMNVESIHYQPANVKSANQRNSGTVNMIYIVEKRMDGRSAKIEDAARRGRVFGSMEIWMKNHSGQIVKYKLNNAYFLNYKAMYVNGKPPMEEFAVIYQSRTKI
ncbi:MAG: hypothetical protein DWP94_04465 [Flavobacterium sp.]|nr:MAG: hypothetical protein DWP94_04465 [Flavobacterium sp.]